MATYAMEYHHLSITRACKVVSLPKSMFYYTSVKDDGIVIDKLKELAEKKPREGQDKYYLRIREAGLKWNYKRVRRIYLMLGLNHRRKLKKRIPSRIKQALSQPMNKNQIWSMDFMSDALQSQRKFRVLNIIDDYNREALWIEVAYSMPSAFVIAVLERTICENGKPSKIRVDNGPEFCSKEFTEWCESKEITVQYIQPGKPMQNGYIERFNRTYRQDILDSYLFTDLDHVTELTQEWLEDYNNHRPHESLGGVSPIKYKTALAC
jgi:putative transposase